MSEMEQKKDSPPLDLLQFYGRSHIITLYRGRSRIHNGKESNSPSFGVVSGGGGGGGIRTLMVIFLE